MISQIFFILLVLAAIICAWQISVADMRRRIIPDVWLWPLMLVGLILVVFYPWFCAPGDAVIGAVFGYTLAIVVGWIFSRLRGAESPIGLGDVKLMAVGGIWTGTLGMAAALVIACVTGCIWARARRQQYIPFAPFFLGGAILTLLCFAFLL